MTRLISLTLIAMLTLMVTACGGSNLDKINGKWNVDWEATMKAAGQALQSDLEKRLVQEMFGTMTLEINAAKKEMTATLAGQTNTSSFEVASETGNTITLKANGSQTTLEILGADSIQFKDANSPFAVTLVRAK